MNITELLKKKIFHRHSGFTLCRFTQQEVEEQNDVPDETMVRIQFKNLYSEDCVEEMASYFVNTFCEQYYKKHILCQQTYLDRIYDTVFMMWLKVVIAHIWKDLPREEWTLSTISKYVKKPHILAVEIEALEIKYDENYFPCKVYKELIVVCEIDLISAALRDAIYKWRKLHA